MLLLRLLTGAAGWVAAAAEVVVVVIVVVVEGVGEWPGCRAHFRISSPRQSAPVAMFGKSAARTPVVAMVVVW